MSNDRKIPREFIVQIPIRNDSGAVVGHKEFVTLPGLMAAAHAIGLESVDTTLVQLPTEANGLTAIVRAVAKGRPGVFTGHGDASPANTHRRVAPHVLRVAESRAIGRALRLMTNVALVTLDELGDEADDAVPAQPRERQEPPAPRPRQEGPPLATGNQLRALWRKIASTGLEGNAVRELAQERLGCDPTKATRDAVSKLLDALSEEERSRANGNGHARA